MIDKEKTPDFFLNGGLENGFDPNDVAVFYNQRAV